MQRTLRRKHDRNFLYIQANGHCKICGANLEPDWQADHTIPFCITQETLVSGMQAVCRKCNLKKGTNMLRKHQVDLKNLLQDIVDCYKKTGVLKKNKIVEEIFPGGGKSTHPIIALKILKDAGIVEKVCWVTPRSSLKNQGAQEFLKPYFKTLFPHDLEIRETESVNDVEPTRGTDGFVTTYQALVSAKGNNPNRDNCNEYEFRQYNYLLFLDEFHHLSIDKVTDPKGYSYYKSVKPLIEQAKFVILASGVILRNNDEEIGFLDYEKILVEGEWRRKPIIDIVYTKEDSIRESANIELNYCEADADRVSYKVEKNGETIKYDKPRIENNRDLSVAIDSEYGDQLLEAGMKHWKDHKLQVNPRAKVIIVGYDQDHCRKIQSTLWIRDNKIITCLAISDESKKAQDAIKNFRTKSNCEVLITCQMAYEGLDCREATHTIVLTKIRSLPWLIQMLTRVMRYDRDGIPYDKQMSYAFVPNDPEMQKALKHIGANKIDNSIGLHDQKTEELKDLLDKLGNEGGFDIEQPIIKDKHSKMGGYSQTNDSGESLNRHLNAKVDMFKSKYGMYGDNIKIYNLLKSMGTVGLSKLDEFHSMAETFDQNKVDEIPMTAKEKEESWRKKIQKLASTLDYKFGYAHGDWNKRVFNAFRKKNRKKMNLVELERCYNWLIDVAKTEAELLLKKEESV